MIDDICIVGSGHSKFGKLEDKSLEDLIKEVSLEALKEAEVGAKDIDEVFLGHFNSGMDDNAFASSLIHQASEEFRFKPASRCENACASGSAAIHAGMRALLSGSANYVLIVGAEKMTSQTTKEVTQALGRASYQGNFEKDLSFPQVFALYAKEYEKRYSNPYEAMAKIASKNHKNALSNPLAQMHKEMSFEFCSKVSDKNPLIAPPLKLSDCSLISDGAAAIVLTKKQNAKHSPNAVGFRGFSHVSDFLPMGKRDFVKFEGVKKSIQNAYKSARLTCKDLDFAEVHDCFTIAELLMYEALGICKDGEGFRALEEGIVYPQGSLPVNLSGGLKAKGHPVGATGVSMHALSFRQLIDKPVGLAKEGANLGMVVNMGGAGVATYASILERTK